MILIRLNFLQSIRLYGAQGVNNVKKDLFHPLILKFLPDFLIFK